ncbi:MAG: hypothetical protein KC503_13955 [Myxococcales bacterium]|nr:hypothetical protein [Myxococcales bacterium]
MSDESFESYIETARALLGSYETPSELWQANDAVNFALSIRPHDASAWLVKSQLMSCLEDDPSALAAAEMALRAAPDSAEVRYVRAAVLTDMERYEEALEALDAAFARCAADDSWLLEDLYYEKAAILDALGRDEEAVATFEAGLKRCPESALLSAGLEPLRRERVRRTFRVIDGGRADA